MHPNAQLRTDFYDAFNRQDATEMVAAYHDDATFSDPVFPDLDADGVRAMWTMLTTQADDLRIEASRIAANDDTGQARWDAWYTFSKTGRKVHNIIDARFKFRDGLIVRHDDSFNFWRWSRQALGLPGLLLGWTPFLQNKVQSTAADGLAKWRAENQ